jgi:hypothetical protein
MCLFVILVNVGDNSDDNIKQEIRRRTNCLLSFHYVLIIWYDTDRVENIKSNSHSIAVCVFIVMGTSLLTHCPATAVSSASTILTYRC